MEESNIKKYAELMRDLELTGLEISENGKTLRLERAAAQSVALPISATGLPSGADVAAGPIPQGAAVDLNLVSVLSPIVGVFYTSPAENQPPFVEINDQVKKGDVLCIIESMKLMNEITAECDGTIVEIGAVNEEVVDYGRVLFRIKKERL